MNETLKDMSADDRRSHLRKSFALDVQLFLGHEGEKEPIHAQLKDLSLLGMCIQNIDSISLQTGDQVRVCLSPSTEDFGDINMRRIIHARVAHNDNESTGLAFESVGIDVLDFMHVLLKNIRLF